MGFTRRCGRNPAIRRRSSGQAILVCAAALLLCLIGLDGCGSSSGGGSASGTASASSTCSASSFVRRDHKSPTGTLPVLLSVRIPGLDIPVPDVNLGAEGDPDDSLQEAHNLAQDGDSALESPDNDPLQGSVQDTQENIDQEATGVGLTEEIDLLVDEDTSGLDASDFGQEVCNAVGAVKASLSNLDTVTQIYAILNQQPTKGSADVASVVQNAVQSFTHAFGACFDTLSVAKQMVEDIEDLFCQ
jgi:hypothetical protein